MSFMEPPASTRPPGYDAPRLVPVSTVQDSDGLRSGSLIQAEAQWRQPPQAAPRPDGRGDRLHLSRWRGCVRAAPLEVTSDAVDDGHVMSIVLRQTRSDFTVGGKPIIAGRLKLGTVFLTGPRTSTWRGTFHESYDHLRAHLPQSIMAECYEAAYHRPPSSALSLFETSFSEDPVLHNIGRALGNLAVYDQVIGPSFVDAIGLALASRLVVLHHGGRMPTATDGTGGLAKWRLERVLAYIEAHLLRPINLAELSDVAGLSRMHFATQFRAATGHPPYAYILRRRILRAQQHLMNPAESIVDVALRVGFSSQAHFTEAFRRAVGETPARWRRARLAMAAE